MPAQNPAALFAGCMRTAKSRCRTANPKSRAAAAACVEQWRPACFAAVASTNPRAKAAAAQQGFGYVGTLGADAVIYDSTQGPKPTLDWTNVAIGTGCGFMLATFIFRRT